VPELAQLREQGARYLRRLARQVVGTGATRYRRLSLALPELGLVLVSVLAATLLGIEHVADPTQVSTRVQVCDFASHGSAAVTYDLTNRDRSTHGYQVHLVVAVGAHTVGSGTSLVTHVDAGATVTGRMLVQLVGDPSGARCTLWAETFDGETGHGHP
jgi:hypothetical protein